MHHNGLAVGVSPSIGLSVGAPAVQGIAPSGQTQGGTTNIADFRPTPLMSLVIAGSIAASAIHGYRRNDGSIGYALIWAAFATVFPIITPAIAIAEGFGEPESEAWAIREKKLAQQDWEWKQEAMAKQDKGWKK
jgi:hypothetical protein